MAEYPNSYWDIADTRENKFIEVKVTSNPGAAKELFIEKASGIECFASLCLVDPHTGNIEWYKHEGGLRGEVKVTTFLAKRRLFLNSLNALETPMMDKKDLEKEIFKSPWFNDHMRKWSDEIWALRNTPPPKNYNLNQTPSLVKVTIEKLRSLLDDPRKRLDKQVVKWRGKILPEPMVRNITCMESDDTSMVDSFFKTIGDFPKVEGDRTISGVLEAIAKWKSKEEGNRSSFSLINDKEYGSLETQNLESIYGIKAKGKCYNVGDATTVQPD